MPHLREISRKRPAAAYVRQTPFLTVLEFILPRLVEQFAGDKNKSGTE